MFRYHRRLIPPVKDLRLTRHLMEVTHVQLHEITNRSHPPACHSRRAGDTDATCQPPGRGTSRTLCSE